MTIVGWRQVVVNVLAEKVGVLSDFIVDEVLEEMHLKENDMRIGLFSEFMKKLYSRLPEDVDRRKLIHEVRDKLIAEYHVLLARV
jgi:ATP/maltotriose-dependent transcriptional regulator MalT